MLPVWVQVCVAEIVHGNEGDDKSDAPPSPPPSRPLSSKESSASACSAHSAEESQLHFLLELKHMFVPPTVGGAAAADVVPEYTHHSLGLHVRAFYEALEDARRTQPPVDRHKRPNLGRSNTVRLRALQRFFLQVGRAGFSTKEQEFLLEFLEYWVGTKAGMAEVAGHHNSLRYHVLSVATLKQALSVDLDAAELNAW